MAFVDFDIIGALFFIYFNQIVWQRHYTALLSGFGTSRDLGPTRAEG